MLLENKGKQIQSTAEYQRIYEKKSHFSWKALGPYVAERAWGTVREDDTLGEDVWSAFPFSEAHLRAYQWGEDGIAAICDSLQYLVLSFAFWNGKDPLLKERLYGLNNGEGNHGEDVKELYYHLEATPTFSYARYLYKYPQAAFPYEMLLKENRKRGRDQKEFELFDTDLFNQSAYFDIWIEYAKKAADDIFLQITIKNQAEKEALLHVLPQLILRNRWTHTPEVKKPHLFEKQAGCLIAEDFEVFPLDKTLSPYQLGRWYLYADRSVETYFTENESNWEKLGRGKNASPYTKEAFHEKIIDNKDSTHPQKQGTKACFHYFFPSMGAKEVKKIYLRLCQKEQKRPFSEVEKVFQKRKKEAEEFYTAISTTSSKEEQKIQKQALSGLIWNQQTYLYNVHRWLQQKKRTTTATLFSEVEERNEKWRHLYSNVIFSMPDKWEYPWFASWDLAFQAVSWSLIDLPFAKKQLLLLLEDTFQHPNGQIPSYEWDFSEVNPPLQAWAALKIFQREKKIFGKEDFLFLERCFHKLLLNFCWWINATDPLERNIFEGGFLGLDNITILDRSYFRKSSEHLDEPDSSGWMAMFCLNLMEMAFLLSKNNSNYEPLAIKFFEHFIYIAAAFRKGYWRRYDMLDAKDFFFYGRLLLSSGETEIFKIRSLVGLIPFFAILVREEEHLQKLKEFWSRVQGFKKHFSHLTETCIHKVQVQGKQKYIFSLLHPQEMEKFLTYFWEEEEFLSNYGLRSLSKFHEKQPFIYQDTYLKYEPGESLENIKGGNSNWRGPVWFPINYLFIQSLKIAAQGFATLQVKVPGKKAVSLLEMAQEYSQRLIQLFQKDKKGKRPIWGEATLLQQDPEFCDYLLFFEYYHPETGRGMGASHQTGWSSLVANLIEEKENPREGK